MVLHNIHKIKAHYFRGFFCFEINLISFFVHKNNINLCIKVSSISLKMLIIRGCLIINSWIFVYLFIFFLTASLNLNLM